MENRKNNTMFMYVALVAVVALVAYGLGLGTMYVANGGNTNQSSNQNPTRISDSTVVPGSAAPTQSLPANPPVPADLQDQFELFWEAYRAVEGEYYGRPVDRQKMIYGAAKGMMETLGDPYSAFLTPQEAESVASSLRGNFDGIGIWFELRNDLPTVVAPIPNTPAERAGIRSKDNFIAVDGRDITRMTTDEIATLVRGPAGTKVRITFVRAGKPFDVEITRAKIEVPAVTLKMLDGNIAHITVTVFGDKTTAELDKALTDAQAQKATGIILDLRNNGGGWVDAAEQMLGRFLPDGTIAYYELHKADGSDDRPQYVQANGPKLYDIPLVVLVNGGSASASEIVSGALQDHGRAKLIGEQTFGKGSEQHVHSFDDGASARITFAHWLTPKKQDINPRPTPTVGPGTPVVLPTFTPMPSVTVPPPAATATAEARPLTPTLTDRGLTPDIVVIRTEKDFNDDKDPQLERAQDYLKNGK